MHQRDRQRVNPASYESMNELESNGITVTKSKVRHDRVQLEPSKNWHQRAAAVALKQIKAMLYDVKAHNGGLCFRSPHQHTKPKKWQ